jgi:hypothetical protein
MACSCCSSLISASLSQAARFGHLLVVVATFVLAIIIGQQAPNQINGYNYYTKVDLTGGCDSDYQDSCIYRQLIYRASFSLALLFALLALLTVPSDYVNKSFWVIKFGFAIGLFIAFWWANNGFFSGWAETARVISFIWLVIQGLLLIDFSHDAHDILMSESSGADGGDRTPYIFYLVISFCCLFAAVLGLVYLFLNYTGCDLGMFFTVLTLIVGVLTTFISLLNSVNKGLLTPCIVFAYSVFMCWYALLNNPDESCNPTANSVNGAQNGGIIIVAIVSMVILLYCVVNGTKILNIFNPEGEGVMMSYTTNGNGNRAEMEAVLTGSSTAPPVTSQPSSAPLETTQKDGDGAAAAQENSSGTAHERAFFHVILLLISCYGAMILTSWGSTNGAPASNGSGRSGNESMWLIIVSQWIFLLLYIRVLQVSYQNNM